MKRVFAAATAVFSALALATPAAAGGPTRTFAPSSPVLLQGVCAFDVTLTFPISNDYTLTYTDSAGHVIKQIITGHLTVVYTNDATGKSVASNFSGPAVLTFYPDSDPNVANGTPKVFEFTGPQGGPVNGTLILGSGRTVFTFDPQGNLTSFTQVGHFTDMCVALA